MKLIIGLGNPGSKYIKNRHNAGHMFVDFLRSQEVLLRSYFFKTDVFMNDSGIFVKKHLGDMGDVGDIGNLYIAHDDLDLKLGTYKIQFGVGPKVHNGILSIENSLNSKDFWRIRIGVDNRKNDDEGKDYVLQDFTKEELEILKQVQDDIYAKIRDDLAKS